MTTHKQVEISGRLVDEGLAELLTLLWDNSIDTQYSCQGQGNPSNAYILFPTVDDAIRFVEGTLKRTGFYGCFSTHLRIEIWQPFDANPGWRGVEDRGPIRAGVDWPFEFTPIWTAAWRGELIEWEKSLNQADAVRCSHQEEAHA